MRSLLYIIGVILLVAWAIGTFVYAASSIIHILLALAIVCFLLAMLGTTDV